MSTDEAVGDVGAAGTEPTEELVGGDVSVPEDRCGYSYDVSTLEGVGKTSCWRPVWADQDRCVWHSDEGDKPRQAYEELAPSPGERLDGACISEISLTGTDWFEDCVMIGVELNSVDLRSASFVRADFREAEFNHVDAREANFLRANLEDTTFDACDLRHAQFADARLDQAVFSHVRISRETDFGKSPVYEREIDEATSEDEYIRAAQAAIWSSREIQELFRRNALPTEARHYYLKEKDARRRLAWHLDNYGQALRAEASRWVTGYSMSPWRVLATSLVIIVVSALLYPLTGGLEEVVAGGGGEQMAVTWEVQNPESASRYYIFSVFLKSLYFSVVTFTTLGYGDISPIGTYARTVAGIEALTGTALMALLVFVLSRRIQ